MSRFKFLICWAVLTTASAAGCNVTPEGGGFGTETGTETGEPEDDGLVCPASCSVASDCCLGDGTSYPGGSCVGMYPNNWQCVAGECVSGGCSATSDCPLPDLQECVQVGGVGTCVYPCVQNGDCAVEYNMPGTWCGRTDDNQNRFCSQYGN